jgi:hypothetical protein
MKIEQKMKAGLDHKATLCREAASTKALLMASPRLLEFVGRDDGMKLGFSAIDGGQDDARATNDRDSALVYDSHTRRRYRRRFSWSMVKSLVLLLPMNHDLRACAECRS